MGALAIIQPHLQAGRVKLIAVTNRERAPNLPDLPTVAIGVAVVLGGVAFVRYENAREDPALSPALFRVPAFTAACIAMCFSNLALYATLLALPALLVDSSSTRSRGQSGARRCSERPRSAAATGQELGA